MMGYSGIRDWALRLTETKSAPERYQQIIRQALSDIGGVRNIAVDLRVHGKNDEEHERHLHELIQKLEEKNLILKLEKCQFRMDKVVFMGLLCQTMVSYGIRLCWGQAALLLQQRLEAFLIWLALVND